MFGPRKECRASSGRAAAADGGRKLCSRSLGCEPNPKVRCWRGVNFCFSKLVLEMLLGTGPEVGWRCASSRRSRCETDLK